MRLNLLVDLRILSEIAKMSLEKIKTRYRNILITGGAGFIGSHLCEWYLEQGCKVTVLDNLITGSKKNLEKILASSFKNSFCFHEADVSKPLDHLGLKDFDLVLHFACPASPIDFQKIPLEILQVDSIGTFQALEIALKSKARFMIASTSEVYGDPLVHPQTESYWGNVNPIGLRSCYDETKRFAEAATMVYHRKYGLNTAIVRIFNTYGPRMRLEDGRVVPNFCGQALRNEALTVYGTGSQTRSFCYVDDLVDGIVRLAENDFHEPVNIGNPQEFTILDFAKLILKSIPESKSQISYQKLLHEDDPKQRRPDISRAQSILKWSPQIKVEQGIQKTIDYFRSQLK